MEYFSLFLLNCKIDLFIQALDKAPAVLRQVILKTLALKSRKVRAFRMTPNDPRNSDPETLYVGKTIKPDYDF